MRYLGLDVGTKRVGVAITDRSNTIASPLKVISFDNINKAIEEIMNIINTENISHVVIGKPFNMDGTTGFASERSEKFKKILEENTKAEIIYVDERLTTIEAENILINHDYSRAKRKKIIDGVAAVLILETFLKMKGDNSGK